MNYEFSCSIVYYMKIVQDLILVLVPGENYTSVRYTYLEYLSDMENIRFDASSGHQEKTSTPMYSCTHMG